MPDLLHNFVTMHGQLTFEEWVCLLALGAAGLVAGWALRHSKPVTALAVAVGGVLLWSDTGPSFGVWKYAAAAAALMGAAGCVAAMLQPAVPHRRQPPPLPPGYGQPARSGPQRPILLGAVLAALFVVTAGYALFRSPWVEGNLRVVRYQQQRLKRELTTGVPRLRQCLEDQAGDVRRELDDATPSREVELRSELREIARTLLALDRYEEQCVQTVSQLAGMERKLVRIRETKAYLGEDRDEVLDRLSQATQVASGQITRSLDSRLDGGAIEQAQVESKVQELLKSR